jgi:hypothetical protein
MKKTSWLINPFEYIGGWKAFFIGMAGMLLAAVAAYYGNVRFNGALDVHSSRPIPFPHTLMELALSWLILSVFCYLGGLIFSRSSIRAIDVFGMEALAKSSVLPIALFLLLLHYGGYLDFMDANAPDKLKGHGLSPGQLAVTLLAAIPVLAYAVWSIVLMYKAYSVSVNLKGTKAIVSYIGIIFLAEGISKLLLYLINTRF